MAMGLLPLEELTSAQRQFSERAAAIQRAVRTRELVGSLIKEARSVLGAWYEEVDGALVQLLAARDAGEDFSPGVKQLWGLLTPVAQLSSEGIRVLSAAQAEGRPNRTAQAEALAHFRWALEECVALMRTVLVGWPELDLEVPP